MDLKEFRQRGHEVVDWIADYYEKIESFPVKSQVEPGEIIAKLPMHPPQSGEGFDALMTDLNQQIMPGITHWQSPSFFAYFPANSCAESVLAEMLTAGIGAQCMSWQTSPAATELEERVMEWLREMIGLPEGFVGCTQDYSTTATLCALLTAREVATDFKINKNGFFDQPQFTVYCSSEAHSCIEKTAKVAGFGAENVRKIGLDSTFAMDPKQLEETIVTDKRCGLKPLAVVAALGTTGSTAVDPLEEIAAICKRHKVWLHVDAAYAGTALILPEFRHMLRGIEQVDSFTFNPHKWMLTNFDCSAYFVRDKAALIRTFEILPEYLKTSEGDRVTNFRDWGLALGRRFRALKLWFVIRSYGVEGLQKFLRTQIELAQRYSETIASTKNWELLAPTNFNLICFRFCPAGRDEATLNQLNERILEGANKTGKIFLSHTKLDGKYTLRLCVGRANVEERHVEAAWELLQSESRKISP